MIGRLVAERGRDAVASVVFSSSEIAMEKLLSGELADRVERLE